jgi:hypothetical protein
MSSSIEMKNEVTVNSLLMKSLESATREYARKCVSQLASEYGFSEDDALKKLNLENLKLQVQEMKKRSGGKAKAKEAKAKSEKPEKPEKKEKKAKALFPLPFSKENVLESGCQGLAYNGGLFTQCPKECIASVNYCKQCQSEIDQYGGTTNGTVAQRLACELMEFKDPKGRKPVAFMKMMEKQKLSREQVETEAGKLNIVIDEIHFVAGEKKEKKKKTEVVSVAKEDDLLSQLLNDLVEDEESIDLETLDASKEEEVALKKQQQEAKEAEKAEKAQKKQQQADEKAALHSAKEAEVAQKKQQQADEKAAKEAEKAAKAQQIADEKAAKDAEKAEKAQKIADEKAAKEAEKAAKAQQIADEKAALRSAKAQQQADEKATKAQQIADEKAAKEAEKAQKIADEKALKKKQQEDEKALKKKQQEDEKALKKQQEKTPEKKPKEAEVVAEPVVAAPVVAAPAKKVTVKRITIEGKQYLKTVENLLYDPETKEEMGIYDPILNTIKPLPDDSEDELSEDNMSDVE